ncbi:MAG: DUF2190 domain-containing protein [Alphaproteobacteria bacterium]
MTNPMLSKNYRAEAAVAKRRIVKMGATDGAVVVGAAATDLIFGVSADIDAAITERVDVHVAGIAEVEFGGTVTRGGPVTSDATGRAVAAAPGAGVNNRIIGFALVSAVVGDVAPVILSQGVMQG